MLEHMYDGAIAEFQKAIERFGHSGTRLNKADDAPVKPSILSRLAFDPLRSDVQFADFGAPLEHLWFGESHVELNEGRSPGVPDWHEVREY